MRLWIRRGLCGLFAADSQRNVIQFSDFQIQIYLTIDYYRIVNFIKNYIYHGSIAVQHITHNTMYECKDIFWITILITN